MCWPINLRGKFFTFRVNLPYEKKFSFMWHHTRNHMWDLKLTGLMTDRKRGKTEWHQSTTFSCDHSRMAFQTMHQLKTKPKIVKKLSKPVWYYFFLHIISNQKYHQQKKLPNLKKLPQCIILHSLFYDPWLWNSQLALSSFLQNHFERNQQWAIWLASKTITHCVTNQVVSIFNQYIQFLNYLERILHLKSVE